MTKKELIKYLQSKRQERIDELNQYYKSREQQAKLAVIDEYKLNELAHTISEQCSTLLTTYKECIEKIPHTSSSRYYGGYEPRFCLEKLVKEDLAEHIRDSERIGEDALKALKTEHDNMVKEVHRTYDKLEYYVQDSIKASDAVKYLAELGFDLKIKDIKAEVNTDILFGKKED